MGTPLTANFIAEFLCILAAYTVNVFLASVAAISIILSAIYSIYMFNRISSGSYSILLSSAPDINKREFSILFPLLLIMIILGIYPYLLSGPIDLGLSHFLLELRSNPILLLFFITYIFDNIKNIWYKLNKKKFFINIFNKIFHFGISINNVKNAGSLLSCLKFKYKNQIRLESSSESSNDSESFDQSDRIVHNNLPELSEPTAEQLVVISKIKNWINSQTLIFVNRYGNNGRLNESDVSAIINQGQERAVKAGINPEWLGFKIQKSVTSELSTNNSTSSVNFINQNSFNNLPSSCKVSGPFSVNMDIKRKEIYFDESDQKSPIIQIDQNRDQNQIEWDFLASDCWIKTKDIIIEKDLVEGNSSLFNSIVETIKDQLNIKFIQNILDAIYCIKDISKIIEFTTWWPILLIIYLLYKQKEEIILYLSCLLNRYQILFIINYIKYRNIISNIKFRKRDKWV
jgi:hypothetical protein